MGIILRQIFKGLARRNQPKNGILYALIIYLSMFSVCWSQSTERHSWQLSAREIGKSMYAKKLGSGTENGTPNNRFPDNYGFGYDPQNMTLYDVGGFKNAHHHIGPDFWRNIYLEDPEYAGLIYRAVFPNSLGIEAFLKYYRNILPAFDAGARDNGGNHFK